MTLTTNEVALFSSLIGLGGALLGTTITMHYHQDERRHTERTRWYSDRKKAYATFMMSAPKFFGIALGEAEIIRSGSPELPEEHRIEHFEMMNEDKEQIGKVVAEIEMVGSPQACKAIKRIMGVVDRVEDLFPGFQEKLETISKDDWLKLEKSLQKDFDSAFKQFQKVAREDLGLE